MTSLCCDLPEITRLKCTKGHMPLRAERSLQFVFGNPKPVDSSFTPESSSLPFLLDVSLAGSVTFHAVHLEVGFAVVFDQSSGEQSHESDGQELSQRPPGEDIIHGGDL